MPVWGHVTLQIALTVAGFWVLIWRLGIQHRNNLDQQRERGRQELQVEIYKTLIEKIKEASDLYIDCGTYALLIISDLETYLTHESQGSPALPTSKRAMAFMELDSKASAALASVLEALECWRVAIPNSEVFGLAFHSTRYDARNALADVMHPLATMLPYDAPDTSGEGSQVVVQKFSKQQLDAVRPILNRYRTATENIQAYLADLITVTQNNMISDLFDGKKAKLRIPSDPKLKVISTDPEAAEELRRYFKEETAWGMNNSRLDKQRASKLGTPTPNGSKRGNP